MTFNSAGRSFGMKCPHIIISIGMNYPNPNGNSIRSNQIKSNFICTAHFIQGSNTMRLTVGKKRGGGKVAKGVVCQKEEHSNSCGYE